MNLKIDRDEEKCLECMFLDEVEDYCTKFEKWLGAWPNDEYSYSCIPCNECNLVWRENGKAVDLL